MKIKNYKNMAKKDLHWIAARHGYTDNESFLKDHPTEESYMMKYGGIPSNTGTYDGQTGTYFQLGGGMMIQNSDAPIPQGAPINRKRGKVARSTYEPHPAIHKFEIGGEVESLDLTKQGIEKTLVNAFIDTNQKYKTRPDRSVDEHLRNVTLYSTRDPKPENPEPCLDCEKNYKLGGNYEDFLYNKFQVGGNYNNVIQGNYTPNTRTSKDTPGTEGKISSGVHPYSSGLGMYNTKPTPMTTPQQGINQSLFVQPSYTPQNPFAPTGTPGFKPTFEAPLAGASNRYDPSGCADDLNGQPGNYNQSDLIQGSLKRGGVFEYKIGGEWPAYDYYQDGGEYSDDELEEMKHGGIHIKPENRGKFTEYKKRTGKTTSEALNSSDPHVRQMANFARNAKKWKHEFGGKFDDGGDATPKRPNVSTDYSAYAGPTSSPSDAPVDSSTTWQPNTNTSSWQPNPTNNNMQEIQQGRDITQQRAMNPNSATYDPQTAGDLSPERRQYMNDSQPPIIGDTPPGMTPVTDQNSPGIAKPIPKPANKPRINPYGAVNALNAIQGYQNMGKIRDAHNQDITNNLTNNKYAPVESEGSKGDYTLNNGVFRPNQNTNFNAGYYPIGQQQGIIGKFGGKFQMGGQQDQQQDIPDIAEGTILDLNPSQIKQLMSLGFELEAVQPTKTKSKKR